MARQQGACVAWSREFWDLFMALSSDACAGAALARTVEYALDESAGLVISLPATLALAALSYYCVERPLMVGGSTVLRRRVLGPRSNRHVKGRFPVSVCHDMPRAIAETQTGHLRGTAE